MIIIHSEDEVKSIRASCRIVSEVLHELVGFVDPGVRTGVLADKAEEMVRAAGAEPAFKGYRGYPASICTSVNEQVVHGIPGEKVLKEGDILSLDFGVKMGGFFGDAAMTVPVGGINEELEKLLRVTREALHKGIDQARAEGYLSDIGHAVQSYAEAHGYSVVRDFVGHGIGRSLHEDPQVPNFGEPGRGPRLKPGMVLAIEPMVNIGGSAVKIEGDKWTVVTADGKYSAHFEHTVVITDGKPEILTL